MRTKTWMAALVAVVSLAACGRDRQPAATAEDQLPTLDITHWTERTELFMEYPTLVAGRTALFAVHLTTLGDFKAVTDGRARVEFTPEAGGQGKVLTGPAPSRPGVFRVEDVPPAPGRYRWALVLEGGATSDRHDLGSVTVFTDVARAAAAASQAEDPTAIAYLKEQQWANAFATATVQDVDVRRSIRAPATVHALPGGEAIVAAPAAGRLAADVSLSIGDRVRAGQVLARLEPRLSAGPDRATLEAEVVEARVAVDAARAEHARADRLVAERAVPARRVEDARRAMTVVEARLKSAEARLAQRDEALKTGGGTASGNAFALQAPIAGRLAEVMATPGASYEEGAPLFRIVRTDRVELEVQVPAVDVPLARQVASVALEVPGLPEPFLLEPHHVHDAGVIDARTGALPLQMEVVNPREQLLVGQVATAVLRSAERRRVPAVPLAAVLMEAGRPYVFVQMGGERFARRSIEVADRDGDWIGVTSGVSRGERVVTRGAYDVQLAAAAKGLPAEGHVH